MSDEAYGAAEEATHLRSRHYNATVAAVRRVHDELLILRVTPDTPVVDLEPGRYVTLGLGYWEERIAGCQTESIPATKLRQLALRAYSVSCRLFDERGELATLTTETELEFYVSLVRRASRPPALTPRLFLLTVGDRLHVGPKARGSYTLAPLGPQDNVVMAATGTGEAPHNALAAELLARGHAGQIRCVTCVRYERDLAYLAAHRRLEANFKNYRYLPLTTREPRNTDPSRSDYVGKRYLQEYLAHGDLERDAGLILDPTRTHVFLCGNPAMIGLAAAPRTTSAAEPSFAGAGPQLLRRGFRLDAPRAPGSLHVEQYWRPA